MLPGPAPIQGQLQETNQLSELPITNSSLDPQSAQTHNPVTMLTQLT